MADRNFIIKRGLEVPLIAGADGNTAITMTGTANAQISGDLTILGDLIVSGNDIKSSTGAIAISLNDNDVTVADRLFVVGNIIGSNGGFTAITLSGADVALAGILTTSSSEDVANAGAMLLTKAVSYFSTGATGETATLAAGSEGQFKSMMMTADGGGDMVVTVSNAGWKTSGTGTITFDAIGESCLLQYINSKWYAVGTNGVVFA